jgi:hypothetical protein
MIAPQQPGTRETVSEASFGLLADGTAPERTAAVRRRHLGPLADLVVSDSRKLVMAIYQLVLFEEDRPVSDVV